MTDIADIPVELIDPSPFQRRKRFKGIEELARSIEGLGLIEPIIVRPMGGRWELMAGERRLRAAKFASMGSILAIKREADDSTARRIALEENIQREDLTRIEEIDGWVLHVDAELWKDEEEYRSHAEMNGWPNGLSDEQGRLRAWWLLKKLDDERRRDTDNLSRKFTGQVDIIFSQHPRNVNWRSFLRNDMPLLKLSEPVLEIAIDKNLNKSQTKALGKIVEEDSEEAQEILESGEVTVLGESGYEKVAIEDASSREIAKAPFRAKMKKSDPHAALGTGEYEWYTPKEIIEAARKVMGSIDLDPASTDQANIVVRATSYYTKRENGLSKEWEGKVWMNPPYSQPLVGQFTDKLVQHVKSGGVPEAIVLVNNSTETVWFDELVGIASAICFPQGRIKFWHPDGRPSAPLQGQAIIYIGDNTNTFLREFRGFGWAAIIVLTAN